MNTNVVLDVVMLCGLLAMTILCFIKMKTSCELMFDYLFWSFAAATVITFVRFFIIYHPVVSITLNVI